MTPLHVRRALLVICQMTSSCVLCPEKDVVSVLAATTTSSSASLPEVSRSFHAGLNGGMSTTFIPTIAWVSVGFRQPFVSSVSVRHIIHGPTKLELEMYMTRGVVLGCCRINNNLYHPYQYNVSKSVVSLACISIGKW